MFAFSTCWNSDRHTDGRAMLNEVRSLGFEYAELSHGIRLSLVDGIQQAIAAGEIRISSLHNFCPLPLGAMGPSPDYYLPSSKRAAERGLAVRHTLRTIDCAASVGAKVVVLHLGLVVMRNYTCRLLDLAVAGRAATPRFDRLRARALRVRARKRARYLEAVSESLMTVTAHARARGIKLGIETRLGLEEIPDEEETDQILRQFGPEVIGYWHDVGHSLTKEQLGVLDPNRVLERFRGRTVGMHLQDFLPPVGDHLPPGLGTFDFARLAPYVTADQVLTWEIHPSWPAEKIVPGLKRVHQLLAAAAANGRRPAPANQPAPPPSGAQSIRA